MSHVTSSWLEEIKQNLMQDPRSSGSRTERDLPRGASLSRNVAFVMRIAPAPELCIAPPSPFGRTLSSVDDQNVPGGQLVGYRSYARQPCVSSRECRYVKWCGNGQNSNGIPHNEQEDGEPGLQTSEFRFQAHRTSHPIVHHLHINRRRQAYRFDPVHRTTSTSHRAQ